MQTDRQTDRQDKINSEKYDHSSQTNKQTKIDLNSQNKTDR